MSAFLLRGICTARQCEFSSAILARIQLDELVSDSDESYLECAIRLALDKQYNARVRAQILESRQILYQDSAPIRALEEFLAGLKAGAFS